MKVYSQLEVASLENLASDPSNLPEGRIWLNTTSGLVKQVIGGVVKTVATADNSLVFSNKTISGSANTITNVSGSNVVNTPSGNLAATDVQAALNELQSDVDTRATSSSLTTHTSATTSVHGISDTADLLTTSNAKVVTNKDIDGGTASNTNRVTIPKDTLANLQALTRKEGTIVYATDTDKFYSDNGTTLVPVGSGSGAKNYFTDGDSEGANPFTLFNDGSAIWVDGTGGSPTATITQSATTPLSGQKSFLFTSGTQYDTAKASITIDREDKFKIIVLEAAYEKVSGTYADGDLQILLYDSTNGAILYPTPVHNLQASGTNAKQQFAFQATDSLTYQILIHQKTSATFSMRFEMKIGPQQFAGYAPITSDDEAITPVFDQFGTVTAVSIYKSQVGKDLFLRGNFTTGTVGGGTPYIEMPSGLKIDDTKLPSGVVSILGRLTRGIGAAGAGIYEMYLCYDGSDNTKLYFTAPSNGGNPYTVVTVASSFFASSEIQFISYAKIPVLGWSSESKVVSEYDGRVVAAKAYISSGYTPGANDYINYDTVEIDTHASVVTGTGTSWRYTAKVSGKHRVSLVGDVTSSTTNIVLVKNGTDYAYIAQINTGISSGTTVLDLAVGDWIAFKIEGSLGLFGLVSSKQLNYVSIELLSGAQQILASQTIIARASGNPAASSAGNPIIFPNIDFDTTGSYDSSTGRYTCPVNGYCKISGAYEGTVNGERYEVYKNGSLDSICGYSNFNGDGNWSTVVKVLAGDIVDVRGATTTSDLTAGNIVFEMK